MENCSIKERTSMISEDKELVVINQPKRHLLDINFREIWEYRDLLIMFVKRDIVTVYKQTVLGPIWFFLQPLMTMLVYIVVFGNIAKIPTDGIPQPLFYLAGITMWNYFADCFTQTADTFSKNAQIFGKVYFPRLIIPLSKVISGIIKFFIQTALFLVLLMYYLFKGAMVEPSFLILIAPYLIFLMAVTGLGAGIIFSSLTTKYRDLTFLITFGIQLLMYATPVIYPLSAIPEKYKPFIWLNPMSHVIEGYKMVFLGEGLLSWSGLIYTTFFAFVLLSIGVIIFNKTEQDFMDTV